MLSCKNCGAQMSGIDLVCKNCGTPWGKKHKSRTGLYLSVFALVAVGAVSYIFYTPGAKEKFMTFYNNVLAAIPSDTENNIPEENPIPPTENKNTENEVTLPPQEENEIIPPPVEEPKKEPTPPVFTWVSASSSLKSYEPELTIDGKLETAWLEDVKGNGIGEWIMYSAETEQTVSSITIYTLLIYLNTAL